MGNKKVRRVGDLVESNGITYKIIYYNSRQRVVGIMNIATGQRYEDSIENLRNNYEDSIENLRNNDED